MAQPADLGPEIDPSTIVPGDGQEYYWNLWSSNPYVKVTITKRRDAAPDSPHEYPYFWLYARPVENPGPYDKILGINPVDYANPHNGAYHKFYKIRDSAQIQAQTNALRNLGRNGKVPMNIAMHKLPGYLGLGGKRRSVKRHGRRGPARKRRTYKS